MSDTKRNRFVGARSYEEKDKDIFFGRESEADDLFQLVNINTFTLLYGRSGLGKTSILQAGLFPKLRANNYLPIYIRPNYRNKETDFVKDVEKIIKESFKKNEISGNEIKSPQSLWEYFHENNFLNNEEKKCIPVLVFDQFEEIFTLGSEDKSSELRKNTKDLVNLLSDIIENNPPSALPEEKRIELQYKYVSSVLPVKIIFSFREEYLGDFYDLSRFIPSIAYSNLQYKLGPLSYDKAYKIIDKASAGLFEADAIKETLKIISESKTEEEAKKRDIDSFLLSIFCENQLETFNGDSNSKIQSTDIKKVNVQNIIDEKYKKALKDLQLNKAEIMLLEERLLSPEGYRWPFYLDLALAFNPTIRESKIAGLEEAKILKRYSIDGRRVIEIIHDKYAVAVKSARDFRRKAEQEKLDLLKEQEDLKKKQREDQLMFAQEQARLEAKDIQDQLRLADEKLVLKSKIQRRSVIAGITSSLLAILAFYLFLNTRTKEKLLASQNAIVNMQKEALTKRTDNLGKAQSLLIQKTDSLTRYNSTLKVLSDQLGYSLRYAKVQREEAMLAKNQAEKSAYDLGMERDKATLLNKTLLYQIEKNNTAKKLGQLLSLANNSYEAPALKYAALNLAKKLDSTDRNADSSLNDLIKFNKYFESIVTTGKYASFTSNGDFLVTKNDSSVQMISKEGNIISTFKTNSAVNSLVVSHDNKKILIKSDNNISVWDIYNKRQLFKVNASGVNFATFFEKNSNQIAIINNNLIRVYDDTGDLVDNYYLDNSKNFRLSISALKANESNLYVGTSDGVFVYDIEQNKSPVRQFKNDPSTSWFLIPNRNDIVSITNNQVILHDVKGKVTNEFKIGNLKTTYDKPISIVSAKDGSKALIVLGKFNQQQQQQQQNTESYKALIPCADVIVDFNKNAAYLVEPYKYNNTYSFTPVLDNAAFSNDGAKLLGSYYNGYGVSFGLTLFNVLNNDLLSDYTIPVYRDLITFSLFENSVLTLTSDKYSSYPNKIVIWVPGNVKDLDIQGKLKKFSQAEVYERAGIKD
jgi:hypothetical protein